MSQVRGVTGADAPLAARKPLRSRTCQDAGRALARMAVGGGTDCVNGASNARAVGGLQHYSRAFIDGSVPITNPPSRWLACWLAGFSNPSDRVCAASLSFHRCPPSGTEPSCAALHCAMARPVSGPQLASDGASARQMKRKRKMRTKTKRKRRMKTKVKTRWKIQRTIKRKSAGCTASNSCCRANGVAHLGCTGKAADHFHHGSSMQFSAPTASVRSRHAMTCNTVILGVRVHHGGALERKAESEIGGLGKCRGLY